MKAGYAKIKLLFGTVESINPRKMHGQKDWMVKYRNHQCWALFLRENHPSERSKWLHWTSGTKTHIGVTLRIIWHRISRDSNHEEFARVAPCDLIMCPIRRNARAAGTARVDLESCGREAANDDTKGREKYVSTYFSVRKRTSK